MARSNGGGRCSKRGRSGRLVAPLSPSSGGSFKRRSHRRTGSSHSNGSHRAGVGRAAVGVASRVSARRRLAQRFGQKGTDDRHSIYLSDGESGEDDVFHTPPLVLDEGVGIEAPRVQRSTTGQINTRGSPRDLANLVGALTPSQIEDVMAIGLGALLGFKITEVPLALGHWVVTNFDPDKKRINLGNGRYIPVTEEDVAAIFGLPRGPIQISERDSQAVSPELREWRDVVNQRRGRITVKGLCALLELGSSGPWFKIHFSVVVITTLVASTPNRYANQKTVHMLSSVDTIKDLDWCGYLIRSLVTTHRSWTEVPNRKFTGPLLFLTLLYLDRVVVGVREVPRSIPLVAGWTTESIKARVQVELNSGGFGKGVLDATFSASNPGDPVCVSNSAAVLPAAGEEPRQRNTRGENMGFAQQFAGITDELLKLTSRAVDLVAQPQGDFNFRKVGDAVRQWAAIVNMPGTATDPSPQPPTPATVDGGPLVYDADFIRELDEAELAATGTYGVSDVPSFSLGLTQEFARRKRVGSVGQQLNTAAQIRQEPSAARIASHPAAPCTAPVDVPKPKEPERVVQPGQLAGIYFSMRLGYPYTPLPHVCVMWLWIFSCPTGGRDEVLFQYADRMVKRAQIQTLREGSNVSKIVVDAWCYVLNAREKVTTTGGVTRLFLPTSMTIGTVVATSASEDSRISWFGNRMDKELQRMGRGDTADIDMFIFPIFDRGTYYMMAISCKPPRFDIIDSSSARKTNEGMYGAAPEELIMCLGAYLDSKQQGLRAAQLEMLKPKRMQMAWRDTTSTLDAGIFTMRHMESYVGGGCAGWDSGLQRGDSKQLLDLRKRYMHNILLSVVITPIQTVLQRALVPSKVKGWRRCIIAGRP